MMTGWTDDRGVSRQWKPAAPVGAGARTLAGRRVVVVGLARSGRAAVDLLLARGARVVATDLADATELGIEPSPWLARGVALALGGHPPALLDEADLVVVSPGVPSDAPFIVDAQERGIPVIGELELAYGASQATWLAVTGTNGKTTTTALLGELVKASGRPAVVAGNIGVALSGEVISLGRDGLVVAEVSSFQLDTIDRFRPHVAVLLNLTEDHLDRYPSLDDYARSKARIFENQTADDFAVLNADDPRVAALGPAVAARVIPFSAEREVEGGVFVRGGEIVSNVTGVDRAVARAADLKIPGPHNLSNALGAVAAATTIGVAHDDVGRALTRFSPLAHRMEPVGEIAGVLYVNDSKATNVDAVSFALRSYERPIILIAGGKDKGADFSVLRDPVTARVKRIVLIGSAAGKIEAALRGAAPIEHAPSLDAAVRAAAGAAEAGDVVLLSPACASFDMFEDYEDRGRQFRAAVERLTAERGEGGTS